MYCTLLMSEYASGYQLFCSMELGVMSYGGLLPVVKDVLYLSLYLLFSWRHVSFIRYSIYSICVLCLLMFQCCLHRLVLMPD